MKPKPITKTFQGIELKQSTKSNSWLLWNRPLGFWGDYVCCCELKDTEVVESLHRLFEQRIHGINALINKIQK